MVVQASMQSENSSKNMAVIGPLIFYIKSHIKLFKP
jgi:hypothetical protein